MVVVVWLWWRGCGGVVVLVVVWLWWRGYDCVVWWKCGGGDVVSSS